MELRSYDVGELDLPVKCPAGERIGETLEGPACKCKIEDSVITAAKDWASLTRLCMGDHVRCATWRAGREKEWEGRSVEELIGRDGLERTFDMDDMREITARRDAGDIAGAKRGLADIKERQMAQAKERGLP